LKERSSNLKLPPSQTKSKYVQKYVKAWETLPQFKEQNVYKNTGSNNAYTIPNFWEGLEFQAIAENVQAFFV